MLYYDYWPCCCRPKVAGFVIPVYLNGYAMIVSAVCAYLLTLDGDCFQVRNIFDIEFEMS